MRSGFRGFKTIEATRNVWELQPNSNHRRRDRRAPFPGGTLKSSVSLDESCSFLRIIVYGGLRRRDLVSAVRKRVHRQYDRKHRAAGDRHRLAFGLVVQWLRNRTAATSDRRIRRWCG